MALSSTKMKVSSVNDVGGTGKALREKLFDLLIDMSDQQCAIIWEAFKLSEADPAKSPEECLELAAERLGMSLDEVRRERPDTAVVPPKLGRFSYESTGILEYKS